MDYLAGHLTCPCQVQNCVDDVFYLRHRLKWLPCRKRFLGDTLVQWRVDDPGATALKRMPSFAYSIARLQVTVFKPPFVIIETEAFSPAIG